MAFSDAGSGLGFTQSTPRGLHGRPFPSRQDITAQLHSYRSISVFHMGDDTFCRGLGVLGLVFLGGKIFFEDEEKKA